MNVDAVKRRCFVDVKKVINKTDLTHFFPIFATSQDMQNKYFLDYVASHSVYLCSFIDNSEQTINFFFTKIKTPAEEYTIISKRKDSKLNSVNVKPFIFFKVYDWPNYIT